MIILFSYTNIIILVSSVEAEVVKKSMTFDVSSKATCLLVPNRTVTA